MNVMMRAAVVIVGTALIGALLLPGDTRAQSTMSDRQPSAVANTDTSMPSTSTSRRRAPRRIQIYPRRSEHWQPDVIPHYNPGPDAVRVCNATYVEEARPSGTVIVPRMSCYWRRG